MKNAPSDQTKSILSSNDTSAHTQRLQILAHLRKKPLNTFELRELGHMAPAPRILELRAKGFVIVTSLEDVIGAGNKIHKRVARYFLVSEPPAQRDAA